MWKSIKGSLHEFVILLYAWKYREERQIRLLWRRENQNYSDSMQPYLHLTYIEVFPE